MTILTAHSVYKYGNSHNCKRFTTSNTELLLSLRMASKSTEEIAHSNWNPCSESDSEYDSPHSQYNSDSHKDESDCSTDPEDSEVYRYGYLEADMLSTEHNLTTAQPMIASSISQQELACGTDTLPLSPSVLSLSSLEINASMQPTRGKKPSSPHNQREAKRLKYLYNPNSKEVRPNTTVTYIGESDANFLPITSQSLPATIDPTMRLPVYYQQKTTDWHARNIFNLDIDRHSPTGLQRTDLYVYAVEANTETKDQCAKSSHRRNMQALNTPIERFYPDLWQVEHQQAKNPILSRQFLESLPYHQEPYADALSIIRKPDSAYRNVPYAVEEPTDPLHTTPPGEQHSFSEQGRYLLMCTEPIQFFEAIYRPYEIKSLVKQTNIYRKQKQLFQFEKVTYEEMRCFLGLLLWTSLAQLPSRRAYFKLSKIYQLPHFTSHITRDRFEQLFRMLHLVNNHKIPLTLDSARRFKAKLGKQLKAVCTNSAKLLLPARALSIDEMMVKFYGRSVIRQYIPAKPHKYGVKLWAICCSCCGYSLTQSLYLGSSVQSEGGRDVVIELAEPYFDKGYVVFCDRFFSHLDLAAYLRARSTGLVGTANAKSLPSDLNYLVSIMHPLTWAYKWFNLRAKITTKKRKEAGLPDLEAEELVCLLVWMDKKYRTEDKKVVFITNCLSAIPTSVERDCHRKNIRDENRKYSRVLISSPPVLKAYNYCMGGVDRHDRLLGQHSIPLTTSRGYMKVFYHLLDSAVVNAWILYKTAKQAKGEWNMAAQRRHTLAWFKECVILSLCGKYTSRRRTPFGSDKQTIIPQVSHSLQAIARHQVQSMVNIPAFQDKPKQARCSMCHQPKRTACIECLQVYCYDCGRQHLEQLLLQHSLQNTAPKPEEEQTNTPSPITDSTTPTIQPTHNSDSDSDSDDNSDSDGDISI